MYKLTMDFWDLLDSWKNVINIVSALLLIALLAILLLKDKKSAIRLLSYIIAAISIITAILLLGFKLWTPSRLRDPEALRNLRSMAIVTMAADTHILIGEGEEGKAEKNPEGARTLACMHMEQLNKAFKQSFIYMTPIENVIQSDYYSRLAYPNVTKRTAHILTSETIISARKDLYILPVNNPGVFKGLPDVLNVDALLIVQSRYKLYPDWRNKVPFAILFTKPYWRGTVRTRAWIIGKDGKIIWRYRENVKSEKKERSRSYYYFIGIGSKIKREQCLTLHSDAMYYASEKFLATLEQDIKSIKK